MADSFAPDEHHDSFEEEKPKAEEKSIWQRAKENLIPSLIRFVRNQPGPVDAPPIPADHADTMILRNPLLGKSVEMVQRPPVDPMGELGSAAHAIGTVLTNSPEAFAQDPIGTLALPLQLLRGGKSAITSDTGKAAAALAKDPVIRREALGMVLPQAAHAVNFGSRVKNIVDRLKGEQPGAPPVEPVVTQPGNIVPKEPQFEEMPPTPARREFVSPGGPPAPVAPQPPTVQILEPQFEEMGPIPLRREFTPQPTSTQMVAQEAETLDAVAKSLAGKKFASLTPNQQVTARQLAAKLKPVEAPAPTPAPAVQPAPQPTATDAAQALAAETGQEGTIPFSKPAYQKRDAAAGQPSVEPEGFKMLNRAERHSRALELSQKLHEAGVTAESLGGIKTADLPAIGKQAGVEIPATDSARQALLDEALFELRKKQRVAPAAQALADAMQQ